LRLQDGHLGTQLHCAGEFNNFWLAVLERFSFDCQKKSGNHFGFGFTTVQDWLSSLIAN